MKRYFLLFFAVIFLVSCGANVSENKDTNETSETQESIIVPYVEKSKTYYSEYGIKSIVNSYGFCNLDGDVVIEPSDDISTLSCYETDDGFSFYVVGLGQSEQSAYANGFDPMKTLIIPASGEWCVELDEVGWWTISAGDGAIFASLDVTRETRIIEEKTLIYDYNGNLIKEFGPSSYVSEYSKMYEDCVEISLITDHPDKVETIYVNSKGEIVEDPKKNGHEFNEYGVKISRRIRFYT